MMCHKCKHRKHDKRECDKIVQPPAFVGYDSRGRHPKWDSYCHCKGG